MVGEMVQNSQSLYSFTFNAVIFIHEYIYSHSTTKFIFRKYINSHFKTIFLFTNIFTHILRRDLREVFIHAWYLFNSYVYLSTFSHCMV